MFVFIFSSNKKSPQKMTENITIFSKILIFLKGKKCLVPSELKLSDI